MMEELTPLHPPAELPEILRGNWLDVPPDDPITAYWSAQSDRLPGELSAWEVARLHQNIFLYREKNSRWSVVAKFYVRKTPQAPDFYANQEYEITKDAFQHFFTPGRFCSVQPYGVWRGVLFLENVEGLNLGDVIAVRRSRPGSLQDSLEKTAALLADLHNNTVHTGESADFAPELAYGYKMVQQLARFGVLIDDPVVTSGLEHLLSRWAEHAPMHVFTPCRNHGDATTSNFVFPWQGLPTAIDWERSRIADPAADLGRLLAEVSHSIQANGGSPLEAEPSLEYTRRSYCRFSNQEDCSEALLHRSLFYQAVSTLRIARNGWISRQDRLRLVAQAYGLLTRL